MSPTTQIAYTEPSGAFPGYLNIREAPDRPDYVRVTVREVRHPEGVAGYTATLDLSPAAWADIRAQILAAA